MGEGPPGSGYIRARVQLAPGANGVDVVRQVLFAGLSIVVLIAVAIPDSSALGRRRAPSAAPSGIQDRYCLQGRRWGYPGNCLFSTYEQCHGERLRDAGLLRRQPAIPVRGTAARLLAAPLMRRARRADW
jgi:Protein of unknown function (DUF3551)